MNDLQSAFREFIERRGKYESLDKATFEAAIFAAGWHAALEYRLKAERYQRGAMIDGKYAEVKR